MRLEFPEDHNPNDHEHCRVSRQSAGIYHRSRSVCNVAVDGFDLPIRTKSFGPDDRLAGADMEYRRVYGLRSLQSWVRPAITVRPGGRIQRAEFSSSGCGPFCTEHDRDDRAA